MTDAVETEVQSRAAAITARHTLVATELADHLSSLPLSEQVEEIAVALATEFRFGVNYAKAFWFGHAEMPPANADAAQILETTYF